ncbi:MAG: hypothetical protein JNL82_39165 [Myxococcales bacterium]|nr:hypothetical protein [Myxococcales bacterium]
MVSGSLPGPAVVGEDSVLAESVASVGALEGSLEGPGALSSSSSGPSSKPDGRVVRLVKDEVMGGSFEQPNRPRTSRG